MIKNTNRTASKESKPASAVIYKGQLNVSINWKPFPTIEPTVSPMASPLLEQEKLERSVIARASSSEEHSAMTSELDHFSTRPVHGMR